MVGEPDARLRYEDYLAAERAASTKHEYVGGVVIAVAGGSPEHARLASSLPRLIGNAIIGRPCAVFSSDLRVRIVETNRARPGPPPPPPPDRKADTRAKPVPCLERDDE